MGVARRCMHLYMYDVVVQTVTFVISSTDKFLF